MRDSLTVFAVLLILVLTAALVGPYLVDWSSHRGFIEAKLTEAAGTPVAIAGPIEVRLLPQPTFRLGQVTVGRTEPGRASLTAARLDAQVSLTALMRGDIQVTEATLQQPRVDLSTAAGDTTPIGLPSIADPQRIQIEHVGIVGGAVTFTDPGRGTTTITGIDLDGEATSLLGPFKFSGQVGTGQARHAVRLSTGAYENGRLRMKLGVEGGGSVPTVDLDGSVTQARAPTAGRAGAPRFDGSLVLTGAVALPDTPATIPWRLATTIQADGDAASLADLELRAGTDLRGLVATGTGDATLKGRPALRLKMRGSQINADTLAVTPDGSTLAPPRGLDLLGRLIRMARGASPSADLPVRLDLDYAVDTASAGPQSIFGIAGRLILDGEAPAVVAFAASGPDGARLSIDGRLDGGTAPLFRGRLEANVRDAARFGDWLSPALPEAADWIRRTVPARSVSFGGTVDLSAVGGAARDATLTLDRTTLTGTLAYTGAVGNDRARLFADLRADAFALDDLPVLDGGALDWSALDLDVTFEASAIRIASRPGVPSGTGPLSAGQIALRIRKSGPLATLDRFAADLGTAKLQASGSLDATTAKAQVIVDAPDLMPIADLLAHIAPGRGAASLQARAAALSPARFNLRLDASRGGDGSLLPEVVSIVGRANGTDLEVELKPDRPGDLDPATAQVSARLAAKSPQSLVLLRQMGMPLAAGDPNPVSGEPAQVEAQAHGSFASGFDATLDAKLGGADVSFRGKAKPDLGSGRLNLNGTDLLPALKSAGIMAASATGPLPLRGDADLSWHDSSVALRHLSGRLAGVSFAGDLSTDLSPLAARSPRPVLFGTLSLDRLDLATLFGLAVGLPAAPETSLATPTPQWSDRAYGPTPLRLPRTEIAIKAASLVVLARQLEARDASFTLRSDPGAFTLADLTGKLNHGNFGGSLTLRRDGPAASLAGTVSLADIGLAIPDLGAKLGGSIDLAASGTSPAALVASLAGRGSIIVANAEIASADPSAIPRTAHMSEQNTSEIDTDQVRALLSAELGRGPLPVGNVAGPASLAAGLLRLGPLHTEGDGWTADTEATVDLQTLTGLCKTSIKERQPLPDWKGEPAQIGLVLDGLPALPDRELDAIGFVNALQARAIARDQERIDIIQQDIRERAAFNRRLKAIEADQKAAHDQAKVDADARNSEIDRLLDQEKLVPFEPATPRLPASPAGPASGSTQGPKVPRPTSPQAGGRAQPPSVLPKPRSLQPRLPPLPPSPAQAPQRGPGLDPSVDGRY